MTHPPKCILSLLKLKDIPVNYDDHHPKSALHIQLTTLELIVEALLSLHQPTLSLVHEKLEQLQATVTRIPEAGDDQILDSTTWHQKLAACWQEYDQQLAQALYPGAVAYQRAKEKEEQKKEEDEQLIKSRSSSSLSNDSGSSDSGIFVSPRSTLSSRRSSVIMIDACESLAAGLMAIQVFGPGQS